MSFRLAIHSCLFGSILVLAASAAAQDIQFSQEDYLDEKQGYVDEWAVVSDHYKHSNNCTSDGCIIMGPMSDRTACEEWSNQYNTLDPFDHSRCVSTQTLKSLRR